MSCSFIEEILNTVERAVEPFKFVVSALALESCGTTVPTKGCLYVRERGALSLKSPKYPWASGENGPNSPHLQVRPRVASRIAQLKVY